MGWVRGWRVKIPAAAAAAQLLHSPLSARTGDDCVRGLAELVDSVESTSGQRFGVHMAASAVDDGGISDASEVRLSGHACSLVHADGNRLALVFHCSI